MHGVESISQMLSSNMHKIPTITLEIVALEQTSFTLWAINKDR